MQVGTVVPKHWQEGHEYVMGGVGDAQGAIARGFEKGDLVVLRRSSGMSTPSHLPTSQLPQRIKPQPSPPPSTTAGHTLRLSLCGARIHGDMGGKLHLEGG